MKIISAPSEALNNEMGSLWRSFQAAFSEYFAVSHDMVMKSHYLQEKFEEIMQSDAWWAFEKLSQIPVFQHSYWTEVQKMCRRFRQLDCKFEVREMLKTHPFCACSFNLSQIEEWETLPDQLSLKIDRGLIVVSQGPCDAAANADPDARAVFERDRRPGIGRCGPKSGQTAAGRKGPGEILEYRI